MSTPGLMAGYVVLLLLPGALAGLGAVLLVTLTTSDEFRNVCLVQHAVCIERDADTTSAAG